MQFGRPGGNAGATPFPGVALPSAQLMSESSRTADRARLFWTLLPHLVFAVLFAVTFRRSILPFEDSGREMNTALRLAEGEVLYRDVGLLLRTAFPRGIDGAPARTFGRNLDVLVAWRTVLALLECRGAPAARAAASIRTNRFGGGRLALRVAACAFGIGGSWTFPYSVAALTGTVGVWWALELALGLGVVGRITRRRSRRGPRGGDEARVSAGRPRRPHSRPRAEAITQGSHPGGCPGGGGGRDRVRRSGTGVRHRRHEAPGLPHCARRPRIVATRLRGGALSAG